MTTKKESDRQWEYAVEFTHSYRSHVGRDYPEGSTRRIEEDASRAANMALQDLLDAFEAAAKPITEECRREITTFNNIGRMHHYDGGFDVSTTLGVVAGCVGAVPLTLLIKTAKDIFLKWLTIKPNGIKVRCGTGRSIEVRNVEELEEVLALLDKSTFATAHAKEPKKAEASKAPGRKKTKPTANKRASSPKS